VARSGHVAHGGEQADINTSFHAHPPMF
jgi:hypothetical protein